MLPFRKIMVAALCTAAFSACGVGQAVPTATAPDPYSGFGLPTAGGSLRYSLTASETVLTGYNGTTGNGANTYTNLGGNLAYLSHSADQPFSAVYSGGYLVGSSQFPSYFYQSLSLSQVLRTRDWTFILADSVDYSPQTPVGSLSGIPGAGDVNVAPVQIVPGAGLGILTTYATRVGNTASGTATRRLTGSTTVSFSGSDSIQRYTGSSTGFQGIDNDQEGAGATLQHRIDARTSVGGGYTFSNSSFSSPLLLGAGSSSYQTHTALLSYNRQLSRQLDVFVSAGPQWTVSGGGGIVTSTGVSASVNASLLYSTKIYSAGLTYARSVNNGNGVVIGSRTDTVAATISRPLARIYHVSGLVGFNHSEQLQNSILANYSSSGVVAGGQFSVQVRQPLAVFASYTLQRQLFSGYAPAGIAFNGLTQYVSFGVTYSPKAILR